MLEDVINENLVSIPSALSTGRSGVCVRRAGEERSPQRKLVSLLVSDAAWTQLSHGGCLAQGFSVPLS